MQNDYSSHATVYAQYQMNYPQHMAQQYSIAPTTAEPQSYTYTHGSSSTLVDRRRSPNSRRVSPANHIPLDAPTQPRRYVTPSATSRKDVPAFYNRRHSDSRHSEEEEDELEEAPAPNATDQEKIEWKRRQNTLAARRSRKRKLMQQQALEEAVERLTREREIWKTRALTLQQLLRSHGVLSPEFKDD